MKSAWVRDVPASIGWMLAAEHLPLNADCIKHVLDYLFREEHFYGALDAHTWSREQYAAYGALYSPQQYTLIKMGRWTGKTTAIAGIAANLMIVKRNYRICLVVPTMRCAHKLIEKINDFIGSKVTQVQKNNECIRTDNGNYVFVGSKRSISADLILCDNINHCKQDFIYGSILPVLELSRCKMLAFSD